jgi:hypothetical protein
MSDCCAVAAWEKRGTMGERIGRIGQIETDFFVGACAWNPRKDSYGMTRKIRSDLPNPLNPFSHCITKPPDAKYSTNY